MHSSPSLLSLAHMLYLIKTVGKELFSYFNYFFFLDCLSPSFCYTVAFSTYVLDSLSFFHLSQKTCWRRVELCTHYYIQISHLSSYYYFRYLLRRSALELFMVDRSNFFFDFGVLPFQNTSPWMLELLWTVFANCSINWFICHRAHMEGKMHIGLLFKLVLLIWTIFTWQLRSSCLVMLICFFTFPCLSQDG